MIFKIKLGLYINKSNSDQKLHILKYTAASKLKALNMYTQYQVKKILLKQNFIWWELVRS